MFSSTAALCIHFHYVQIYSNLQLDAKLIVGMVSSNHLFVEKYLDCYSLA